MRKETKYLIKNTEDVVQFIEKIKNILPFINEVEGVIKNEKNGTLVETTYFDSSSFSFYNMHLGINNIVNTKDKIRVRSYITNGNREEFYYLENKKEQDGLKFKNRIKITKKDFELLKSGKIIEYDETLKNNNLSINLESCLEEFNKFFKKNDLKPVIVIEYKRLSYGNDNVKVTIDQNLKSNILDQSVRKVKKSPMYESINVENYFVVEIKYEENDNLTLENIKKRETVDSLMEEYAKTNFSKYVWAINQ